MRIMWRINGGFVRDVLAENDGPKLAYNTISTQIRILEKKGFIGYEIVGKSHRYYPLVSKETYLKSFMTSMLRNYFDDSMAKLIDFLTTDHQLDTDDLEEILKDLRKKKKASIYRSI